MTCWFRLFNVFEPIEKQKRLPANAESLLFFSGSAGIRTQDPYIKSVLLYQLSYRTDYLVTLKGDTFFVGTKVRRPPELNNLDSKKSLFSFSAAPFAGFNCPASLGIGRKSARG